MDFENATPLAARRAGSAMPPARHVARGVSLLPISQRSRDAQLATLGKNHVGMDVHANKQAYANGNPNCNASLLARIPPYPLICIDTFNTELRLRVTFERNDGALLPRRRRWERCATDAWTWILFSFSLPLPLSLALFLIPPVSNSSCISVPLSTLHRSDRSTA